MDADLSLVTHHGHGNKGLIEMANNPASSPFPEVADMATTFDFDNSLVLPEISPELVQDYSSAYSHSSDFAEIDTYGH